MNIMNKRIPMIVANWKMNFIHDQAIDFINQIKGQIPDSNQIEVGIAGQGLFLHDLVRQTADSPIKIVAQNSHWSDDGAFTGETSPKALSDIGVGYTMLGHFERRRFFNETNEYVAQKAIAALNNNLKVIIDIEEIEQLAPAIEGITKEQISNVVLAFEPVYAIGTGHPASIDGSQDVAVEIRNILAKKFDQEVAENMRILYGGSVTVDNANLFTSQDDIDGVLVGTASLDPNSFLKLIDIVKRAQ